MKTLSPGVVLFCFVVCFMCMGSANPQENEEWSDAPDDQVLTTTESTTTWASTEAPDVTLEEVEHRMREWIRSMMRMAFPYALGASSSINVSEACFSGLFRFVFAVRALSDWAFKMLDASGKISGGILEGTATSLGDYDECLDVIVQQATDKTPAVRGEYCLVEIRPSPSILNAIKEYQVGNKTHSPLGKTTTFMRFMRNIKTNPNHVVYRLGICMPSSCSTNDVQSLINSATKELGLPGTVKRCESKNDVHWEVEHKIIIAIVGLFIGFVITGTIVDGIIRFRREENYDGDIATQQGSAIRFCLAFSVYTNTWRLVQTNLKGDALDPLRGIKVFTVIMSIFTHTYALPHPMHVYRYRSAFNIVKFTEDVAFGSVANSSAGVDTFFFIAGFLAIFNRWRQVNKPPIATYIPKFIFIHYLRMTLAQILVICLFLLVPLLGSGPLWHEFIDPPLNACKDLWWTNILFIQNFWGPYDSCLYHTWILAAMMHIFLITAGMLWLMSRWPKFGVLTNIIVILLAAVAVAVVTGVKGFPATFAIYFYDHRSSITMWKCLYVQAYNHIGPYCIGMLTGYLASEYPKIKLKRPILLFCWCASAACCMSIIYGLYDYRDGQPMRRSLAVFYAAAHRPAWAIAIGWVVYGCAAGYGGIANRILSWKALVPLERLCYLAYLIHVPLMYFHGGMQRERIFMGHFSQVMNFSSYTVISFVLAYFCYLLFQAPYRFLEIFLFTRNSQDIWQVGSNSESETSLHKTGQRVNEIISVEEAPRCLFSKTNLNITNQVP